MKHGTKFFWEAFITVVPLLIAFLAKYNFFITTPFDASQVTNFTELILIALGLTMSSLIELIDSAYKSQRPLFTDINDTVGYFIFLVAIFISALWVALSYTIQYPITVGIAAAFFGVVANYFGRKLFIW